jgi:alpha-tubulin suppressor-like RCC1 family protein
MSSEISANLFFFPALAQKLEESKHRMNTTTSFSCTSNWLYFLSNRGDLYAWGENMSGESGTGRYKHTTTHTKVNIPGRVASFSCGSGHALVLTTDSQVFMWGANYRGELGIPTVEHKAKLPQLLDTESLGEIVKVVGGSETSFALSRDGTVYSWGANEYGQLGRDDEIRETPQKVPIPVHIIDLVSGWYHVLALTKDCQVYGWGGNSDGELGLGPGDRTNKLSPILLPLRKIQKIAAGGAHSLALNSDGELYIWGWYKDNNLGRFQENVLTPELILKDVQDVACGSTHNLALKKNGTLFAWGNNVYKQSDADLNVYVSISPASSSIQHPTSSIQHPASTSIPLNSTLHSLILLTK